MDLMDGAVPGLMLRVGPHGATWSLRIRVVGEGGVTRRGHKRKGGKARLTLGEYPATSIEAARGLANTYLDQANKGMSPLAALEAAATAGGLTISALADKFMDDYVTMKELRVDNKEMRAVLERWAADLAADEWMPPSPQLMTFQARTPARTSLDRSSYAAPKVPPSTGNGRRSSTQ